VTLKVTPEQAERLSVAERLGRLDLSVRPIDTITQPIAGIARRSEPPADPGAEKGAPGMPVVTAGGGAVFASDVSSALSDEHAPSASPHMRVIQGNSVETVVFR
jgi:hypothetical protein